MSVTLALTLTLTLPILTSAATKGGGAEEAASEARSVQGMVAGYPSRLDYLVMASVADSSNFNLLMSPSRAEAVPGCR